MPESNSRRAITRSLIVLAVMAVVAGLTWFSVTRIREIQRDLQTSEERVEKLGENIQEYARELEEALNRAREEQERALAAERSAADEGAARVRAESEREQAEAETLRARAESEQTREELEEVRERREQELDRMQEALNRIAPTTRTPSGMVMTLSDEAFQFDFDDASLKPENRETLSRIAGVLLASEGYKLFVDGHTDDVGTDEYNQGLSERRAASVRAYLLDAGIPAELIETHGFGKSEPLVEGQTREARAQNRRVEIGIVDTIVHYERAMSQ